MSGERVVFNYFKGQGFFNSFEDKRFLEIGPKHGQDSLLLATLNPSELVLIDLPSKSSMVKEWLSKLPCRTTYIEGNVLYMDEEQYKQLGTFDLIWCSGVLYHNVEQVRLLKRLYDLCKVGGVVVIESATTRSKKLEKLNVVEIHWPETYRGTQTITHLPSLLAIKSWLEMTGFKDVKSWDVYSKELGRHRAVLTGQKMGDSEPYISYGASGLNPVYTVGDSK